MPKTAEQVRRAYEVLDFIEAHPEKLRMSAWIYNGSHVPLMGYDKARAISECGTAACFAGWAALLAGRTFVGYGLLDGDEWVFEYSADLLGLDGEEEDRLFWWAKDLDEVREVVAEIYGPRPDGAA
jgi:hypothetical protein